MQPGRPFSLTTIRNFSIAAACIFTIASCTIVKNYPANRPFVYQTNINITGNITSDTAEMIASRLRGQLDDSMRSRAISKVIWKVMKNPPRYDSNNAEKSMLYMKALLKSLGYFKDSMSYTAVIDTAKGDQYRTTVTFNVKPGKPVRLDSISFNIKKPELQQLAMDNKNESFLKKGSPFAKSTVSQELDRLTQLYRENGYLKFGRDLLQGLWDTLDVSVLKPTLDPLEQVQILEKLKEQRENPKADLEIRLKPGIDTNRLTKFFIGNISVYPDFNYADTTGYPQDSCTVDGIKIISRFNLFKPHIFPPNIYLYYDSLYDQRNFSKTVNRFNSLGAWRLVNIDPRARPGQDTADFIIHLTPATKYSFTTNLEGSLNNNSVVAGNLVGISINANLLNRNVWKAANQSNTSFRYGIETGRDKVADVKFVQTRQFSFSHSIYFPRPILIQKLLSKKLRENARTIFSVNAAATERRSLFNLTTVNASWGYEFQWEKSSLTLRIPNFEYSSLKPKPRLDTLFSNNPGLRYVFTDGFISSIIAGYTRVGGKKDNRNLFRANMEGSGMIAGLIKSDFLDSNLYRFIKVDAEFIRKIVYHKSALALRFFAGVGYEFSSTVHPNKQNNLPFFKQYFAGGPNSMRAWPLRKLGPGSSVKSFDLNPERYGDVQLEANIEYRFPLGKLAGIKINGALFTDIGNIWFLKKAAGRPDEEVFNLSRLGKDIAIGAGAGLRIDLSFFVIRFDYSYKVKDPSPENVANQNKLFPDWKPLNGQFQLGISYPFIL